MQDHDRDATADSSVPAPCIGIFDSGVGGLSVLRALRAALPDARLLYLADSAQAPYGQRDPAFIVARAHVLSDSLLGLGASLVVVACNTATAAAIDSLRHRHPQIPFVGVEPGLKPAALATRTGHVAVLVTPSTANSERYRRLCERIAAEAAAAWPARPALRFTTAICPGLASAIEGGTARRTERLALLAQLLQPLNAGDVDVAVRGCTHYPLVADEIQGVLGSSVTLVDTAAAVATQVRRLTAAVTNHRSDEERGVLELWATGGTTDLRTAARRWVDPQCDVLRLAV